MLFIWLIVFQQNLVSAMFRVMGNSRQFMLGNNSLTWNGTMLVFVHFGIANEKNNNKNSNVHTFTMSYESPYHNFVSFVRCKKKKRNNDKLFHRNGNKLFCSPHLLVFNDRYCTNFINFIFQRNCRNIHIRWHKKMCWSFLINSP